MDEIKDPNFKAFEAEANKTNPLIALTKAQIGKIMADGALLASIKQHGITEDVVTDAVLNTKLNLSFKPSDHEDVFLQFDPTKNGVSITYKLKF